jgi:hypothetical protein
MEKGWISSSKFSSIIPTKSRPERSRVPSQPIRLKWILWSLECYIKAATMLELISASEMKCCND